MTDKPFTYDACKPHRDGKRRAADNNGDTHVLLCDDAPGDFPVRTYREKDGLGFSFQGNAEAYGRRLVGPAHEPPREWWVNVYPNGRLGILCETREKAADAVCNGHPVECIRVVEARS